MIELGSGAPAAIAWPGSCLITPANYIPCRIRFVRDLNADPTVVDRTRAVEVHLHAEVTNVATAETCEVRAAIWQLNARCGLAAENLVDLTCILIDQPVGPNPFARGIEIVPFLPIEQRAGTDRRSDCQRCRVRPQPIRMINVRIERTTLSRSRYSAASLRP